MYFPLETQLSPKYTFVEKPIGVAAPKVMLNAIGNLRYKVWKGRGVSMKNIKEENLWLEALDNYAYLINIYAGKQLIASARMSMHAGVESLPDKALYLNLDYDIPGPMASFNRLVVHPDFRGQGLSRFLVARRLNRAFMTGAQSIVLDCPENRLGSCRRLGFENMGEPVKGSIFTDVSFYPMILNLQKSLTQKEYGFSGFHQLSLSV